MRDIGRRYFAALGWTSGRLSIAHLIPRTSCREVSKNCGKFVALLSPSRTSTAIAVLAIVQCSNGKGRVGYDGSPRTR